MHNKAGLRIDDLWPKHADLDQWKAYLRHVVSTGSRIGMLDRIGADPSKPRWARVPVGQTCEFCVMLASRGFVYLTRETASLGGGFHNGRCDCNVVPSWGERHIAGYDPEALYRQYRSCADTISTLTTEGRYRRYLATLSEEAKAKAPEYRKWKRDLELAEMRWRDRTWLNTGQPPAITFPDDELKRETETARPQEIRTANRLRKHGVTPAFQVDYITVKNPQTGIVERKGLADWTGGIEIKTPDKAGKRTTIEHYLASASKKQDCTRLIIDNTENACMSDEQLIEIVQTINRFKRGSVYILDHSENLIRIK